MAAHALTTATVVTTAPAQRLPPALSLAGRAEAVIVEADPLLRLHAANAAADLGFTVVRATAGGRRREPPAVTFVGLDCLDHCERCGSAAAGRRPGAQGVSGEGSAGPLTVGYVAGPAAILAAHAAHQCTDGVVHLRVVAGRAAFVYATVAGFAGAACSDAGRGGESLPPDLTRREADVLILILAGFGTAEIATRLWLSPATARSHCRTILRKCGAADRRALRARLIGAGPTNGAASTRPSWMPCSPLSSLRSPDR